MCCCCFVDGGGEDNFDQFSHIYYVCGLHVRTWSWFTALFDLTIGVSYSGTIALLQIGGKSQIVTYYIPGGWITSPVAFSCSLVLFIFFYIGTNLGKSNFLAVYKLIFCLWLIIPILAVATLLSVLIYAQFMSDVVRHPPVQIPLIICTTYVCVRLYLQILLCKWYRLSDRLNNINNIGSRNEMEASTDSEAAGRNWTLRPISTWPQMRLSPPPSYEDVMAGNV